MVHRIALTGGIASGKSTVAGLLAGHGALLIDSDVLAREVVEPGTPGLALIGERFGPEVIGPQGHLDRARLGALVFADPGARADLEAIVHPLIRARSARLESEAPADAIVVHVIPLLVEKNMHPDFDTVVVVDADPKTQLARLASRDGFDEAAARARLAAQATREQRLAVADEVIVNDGTPADLERAVDALWERLTRRARGTVTDGSYAEGHAPGQ